MSFSSNIGTTININNEAVNYIDYLFNEELGLVLEVKPKYKNKLFKKINKICPIYHIGNTTLEPNITITYNKNSIVSNSVMKLRDIWEETSFNLELMQTNKTCVLLEKDGLKNRVPPKYFIPKIYHKFNYMPRKYNVAIIREEGSNGDREMAAAFYMAGFNVLDVCMNDLKTNLLENLNGIVFGRRHFRLSIVMATKKSALESLFACCVKLLRH